MACSKIEATLLKILKIQKRGIRCTQNYTASFVYSLQSSSVPVQSIHYKLSLVSPVCLYMLILINVEEKDNTQNCLWISTILWHDPFIFSPIINPLFNCKKLRYICFDHLLDETQNDRSASINLNILDWSNSAANDLNSCSD